VAAAEARAQRAAAAAHIFTLTAHYNHAVNHRAGVGKSSHNAPAAGRVRPRRTHPCSPRPVPRGSSSSIAARQPQQ
jgi:hypothetical protein